MSSLGVRLKRFRENKRMSVTNLAAAIGVSRSFIYQLERGEVSPSYSTLRSISKALDTTVSVLVGDVTPEEWLVVKRQDRKRLLLPGDGSPGGDADRAGGDVTGEGSNGKPTGSWRAELLPFLGSRNRRMQPVVLELEPGARAGTLPFDHEREDLFFVTRGAVTVVIDGGRELDLEEGDAAYVIFETVVAVENRKAEPATCLWVVSPAS